MISHREFTGLVSVFNIQFFRSGILYLIGNFNFSQITDLNHCDLFGRFISVKISVVRKLSNIDLLLCNKTCSDLFCFL